MITQTTDFVTKFVETHDQPTRVLEVGSKHVSPGYGQLRQIIIPKKEYIGIDMSAGEGVDRVIDGHDIRKEFEKESFDLVVTSDTLEHDSAFWVTVDNMKWALQPEGWMIITVPSIQCSFHGWPKDYWRFMPQGLEEMFEGFENVNIEVFSVESVGNGFPGEILGWGQKPK